MSNTSIILLHTNSLLVQPSMIFCRCVLYVYSLATIMITNVAGIMTNKEEKNATECHASGKLKGLPNSEAMISVLGFLLPDLLEKTKFANMLMPGLVNATITSIHQKAGYFFILSHSIFNRDNI